MRRYRPHGWMRRGFSLLWDARALTEIIAPTAVVSMREFFGMRGAWPIELPGADGDALVVGGLDGCLDALSEQDAMTWLESDLKQAVLAFQSPDDRGALVFWVPSGRARIGMDLADEEYYWRLGAGRDAGRLPLGRCLWAGAESDVARILLSEEREPDPDGDAYVGLFHPRIS